MFEIKSISSTIFLALTFVVASVVVVADLISCIIIYNVLCCAVAFNSAVSSRCCYNLQIPIIQSIRSYRTKLEVNVLGFRLHRLYIYV